MNSSSKELDFLLADVQNPENYSKLIQLVYGELRRMAAHYFKHERPEHTLQPTALVHELYIRLLENGPWSYKTRSQFFYIAAKAMREILVEHARRHRSLKRGGQWTPVPLEEAQLPCLQMPDYVALDEVLQRLEAFDERGCRIVELHVFGGLTFNEIAEVLNRAESTVRRDWKYTRMWLERELERV